jgi:heat shock protein HtpX
LFVLAALAFSSEPGQGVLDEALMVAASAAIPVAGAALVWMLISWAWGDSMMLSISGAREVREGDDDKEYRPLLQSVQNVALAAGLPAPRVYVIDDDGMNAFATGRSPKDASVAFTRGIVRALDRAELEGVAAHEMAHIGNRDIRLDMLIITGVGVTVFTADILLRMAFSGSRNSNDKDRGKTLAVLLAVWGALMVFNLVVSPLIRMAISRKREYLADATGAFITRTPRALARALFKISGNSGISANGGKAMAEAFIADPRKNFAGLFATHPPIEERIKRLIDM